MTRTHTRIGRRTVLKTGTGLAGVALAGCIGSGPEEGNGGTTSSQTSTNPAPSDQQQIEEIAIEGIQLAVTLKRDHDVDQINLIGPDDTLFKQAGVETGVRRVTVPLINPGFETEYYSPGTHRLLALDGDETLVETTLELRPNVEVLGIGSGYAHPENVPDSYDESYRDARNTAYLTVRNTGAPVEIYGVQFYSVAQGRMPPDPTDTDTWYNAEPVEGEFSPRIRLVKESDISEETVNTRAGTVTLFSDGHVLKHPSGCPLEEKTIDYPVTVWLRPGETIERTYRLHIGTENQGEWDETICPTRFVEDDT